MVDARITSETSIMASTDANDGARDQLYSGLYSDSAFAVLVPDTSVHDLHARLQTAEAQIAMLIGQVAQLQAEKK